MSDSQLIHATCVAWKRRGVVITGKSGQGKSALGLALMAYGCRLVGDDQIRLKPRLGRLCVKAPETIEGLIEARGIGILDAPTTKQAAVRLVVNLDAVEKARLPARRQITILGCDLPLIHRVEGPHFAAAILQILRSGWSER